MLQFLCALTAKLLDRDEAKKKQQSFIVTKHSVVEFLYSWKVDFSIRNNIWGLSTKKKISDAYQITHDLILGLNFTCLSAYAV